MFLTYLRRELSQRKRQTFLVAVALGTSIGLIIVVNAASGGIGDAQKTVLGGLYGIGTDISVTKNIQPTQDGRGFAFGPGNTDAAGGSTLSQTRLTIPIFSGTFDQQTLTQISSTKGVAKTASTLKLNQITFKGNIASATQDPAVPRDSNTQRGGIGGGNFNIDMTSIEGVDTSNSNVGPLSGVNIDNGRNFQSSDVNSTNALIDSTYALAQKIDVGGVVAVNGTDFTVVGTVSSASATPETSSNLYIPLAQAQSLSSNPGVVTNIYIAADSSSNTAAVQKAIETLVPDATVSSQADLAKNLSGSLSSASSLVNALSKWLSIIVLLVAFLIAILFTSSGVTRLIRELGTLKAIGWKTNRIVRQIMGESLVTSFFGAIIGLVLGIAGIFIVNAVAPTLSASVANPGRFGGGGPGGAGNQPVALSRLSLNRDRKARINLNIPSPLLGTCTTLSYTRGVPSFLQREKSMIKSIFGRVLAGVAAVLATAGLAFSLSGISMATAAGSIGSSASVATVPQCVWQISGASEIIALDHTEFAADNHTKYVGQDFGLSGAGANTVKVFVGPAASAGVSSDPDNCAWYGSTNSAASGANVTYTVPSSPAFTSAASSAADDNSLGFALSGASTTGSHVAQLVVDLTKANCTNANAPTPLGTDWTGDATANLKTGSLSLTAAQLLSSKTSTSSSCTWTTKLTTYIPGGKTPLHDSDTYTFTGPTITTTLTADGVVG